MSHQTKPGNGPKEIPLEATRSTRLPRPSAIRSEDLLHGQVEVLIEHGTETYRLRVTRSGKLILQK